MFWWTPYSYYKLCDCLPRVLFIPLAASKQHFAGFWLLQVVLWHIHGFFSRGETDATLDDRRWKITFREWQIGRTSCYGRENVTARSARHGYQHSPSSSVAGGISERVSVVSTVERERVEEMTRYLGRDRIFNFAQRKLCQRRWLSKSV